MVAKRPRIEGVTGRFIWKPYKKSRLTKRRGVGKKKKAATRKRKSYIVGSILGGGKRQGPRLPVGGRNALKKFALLKGVDPYKDLVIDQDIQANREILRREAEERKKKKAAIPVAAGWQGI